MSTDLAVGLTISTLSGPLDLNDHVAYEISGSSTRQSTSTSYQRIEVTSPILPGSYVVHVTPGMVSEALQVRVLGSSWRDAQAKYRTLLAAFEQWTFQLIWSYDIGTSNAYTETWDCNAVTQATMDMSQTMQHNNLVVASFAVPRFPHVTVGP